MSLEDFINNLTKEQVRVALGNTTKDFTYLLKSKSVSLRYKDGGYTSFFKEDLFRRYNYNKKG